MDNRPRFSMLLLEPSEIYFEDFSCTLNDTCSSKTGNAKQGRLKICSKSLVFEPKSWTYPIVKLHFKDFLRMHLKKDEDKNNIVIEIKQYVEMIKDNILKPYQFIYAQKQFYIFFDFASAEEVLLQMQQLQRASTLHAHDHNSMIATILHSRYTRMTFDPVMMDDSTEKIICEYQSEKISPLVKHQGKIAITSSTLYFQPFSNVEESPILKLKLKDLRRMYKRRFLLRQVGLELYSEENSTLPHIYLTFQNQSNRDEVYNLLKNSRDVNLEKVQIDEMTLQWQNGVVSNYDYLLYLNCLADRSKNDLTQYPVFPWVVADYTSTTLDLTDANTFRDLSKPMGALNPDRLEKLKERYHEMSEPRFLYGSHYSAPAHVLFYLVRKYPQYMLCLQNGRFDHPDRMFNSFKDVYNNCLRNISDFKELIPEFYDTDNKGDFLVNKYEINFGERHDGTRVNDVILPPWAESPEDIVSKLRDALESDYVSKHLHLWIDLIFGYKQRGSEAIKANNVFHHVCYEGSVDLDDIFDMNDRHALEVQIMEFGQVPKQLFTKPHVKRIANAIQRRLTYPEGISTHDIQCVDTINLHKESVTCALRRDSRIISVGKDGVLKVYDVVQKKQIRSVILSTTPLSCCTMIDANTVAVGSWDNMIYMYNVEYGRIADSFRAHDDSVSCILWIEKERFLISGGWDGVVRVWGKIGNTGESLRGLKAELDHDEKITAITYRYRPQNMIEVIAGTSNGELYIWDVRNKEMLNRVCVHSSTINEARFISSDERMVTVGDDGLLSVTDLSVLHSVYKKQLCPEARGRAMSLCVAADGALWLGDSAGRLLLWDMLVVVELSRRNVHDDVVNSIYFDEPSKTLITASGDKTVKIWRTLADA